jgi:hypothetical protein
LLACRTRPEYERWGEIEQRHYERGRLRAAGAPRRFRQVPATEPANVIAKLHGLRLIPKKAPDNTLAPTRREQEY